MLAQALIYLVDVAFGLFTFALLARFYLQWARAPYRNPLSDFLAALTDFMVRPARRVIPGFWGLDLATLLLAWLVQLIQLAIVLYLKGYQLGVQAGVAVAALALLAAVMILKIMLYMVMVVVIVQAVLTWVSPYSPAMPLLNALARPFLRVFQRLIPPIGNVDLSPLFVVIVCQLLLMLPVAFLEAAVMRLLTSG